MAVTWRALELEGFGRYRDRVSVEFTGGLNTLVADNEAGKSTLVAGLTAVLFGLPRAASGVRRRSSRTADATNHAFMPSATAR